MELPLFVAEGTPTEIGASYGAEARDLIAGNLTDYLRKFRDQSGLDVAAVRAAGETFRATTRAHTPRIADTLDALAESSGQQVAEIYALNARTELLLPAELGATECTAIADIRTEGRTILAQNWDWHPDQAPYTLLLATRDERGHQILTMAEAGMLAKAGLNSAGVGVTVNLLGSDRDGTPGGVPYHVLIRAVLDEPRGLAYALKVCALPRSASINLLIAAAGGMAVDLELAPGAVGRLVPEGGLLTHSNHFNAPMPVRDRIYDFGGSSLFRDYRARQLLERGADVETVLADHLGAPYGICRHADPAEAAEDRSMTVSSVVMALEEGSMRVTAGPPCEHGYAAVALSGIFKQSAVSAG